MSVRFAVALTSAVAVGWVIAGPAAALGPGVFVDPGSPAGKEYGVPLSQLRGAASGRAPVGSQSPPLFGIGISPPGGSGTALSSATRRAGPQRSRRGHATGGRRGAAPTPLEGAAATGARGPGAAPVPSAALAAITRHGSAVPAVTLLGALVLLGGLAFGGLLVAAARRAG